LIKGGKGGGRGKKKGREEEEEEEEAVLERYDFLTSTIPGIPRIPER